MRKKNLRQGRRFITIPSLMCVGNTGIWFWGQDVEMQRMPGSPMSKNVKEREVFPVLRLRSVEQKLVFSAPIFAVMFA